MIARVDYDHTRRLNVSASESKHGSSLVLDRVNLVLSIRHHELPLYQEQVVSENSPWQNKQRYLEVVTLIIGHIDDVSVLRTALRLEWEISSGTRQVVCARRKIVGRILDKPLAECTAAILVDDDLQDRHCVRRHRNE